MFCPKCGKPSGAGAAFCMHCGQRFAPSAPVTAPQVSQGAAPAFPNPQASSKKTTWIAFGTALAMVLALLFGLRATGLLQLGAKNPQIEALKAEGQNPQMPLLRAEGSQPPPALSQGAQRIEMPAEIRRWLEHLEKSNEMRVEVTTKQLAEALPGLAGRPPSFEDGDEENPATKSAQEADQQAGDASALISFFNSVPPPTECIPIANKFSYALNQTVAYIQDIAEATRKAIQSPENQTQALTDLIKMYQRNKKDIDIPCREADSLVEALCDKYQTRKWFSLNDNIGLPGGLSVPGLSLGI